MTVRLSLVTLVIFVGAISSRAQSPVQQVGGEKEPELRSELVRLVKEDQDIRREYNNHRRERGLMVDNKTVNEKLNSDPALKEATLAISSRMIQSDAKRTLRLKEIVAKYGWPGKSLVGTDGERAAYLLIAHAVKDPATGAPDVAFQKLSVDLMSKMPSGEVLNTHLASLTDRVLLYEGKKQMYGTMTTRNEKGEIVPQPIEDEANVDKRRAKLGLEPLDEYVRKENATKPTPPKP